MKKLKKHKIFTMDQAQCYANIMAVLNRYKFPTKGLVLKKAERDRCFFYPNDNFISFLILEKIKSNKEFAFDFTRGSIRECVKRYSMEITLIGEIECTEIEIDIDYFNPDFGLPFLIVHFFAEVAYNKLNNAKTNPFKVKKYLEEKRDLDCSIIVKPLPKRLKCSSSASIQEQQVGLPQETPRKT